MTKEKKPEGIERTKIDANRASTCHPDVYFSTAPVFMIENDGSEKTIGMAKFCPAAPWTARKKQECFQILGLKVLSHLWPADLSTNKFGDIVNRHGPSYWIQRGFHLVRHRGAWVSLTHKELGGVPPFDGDPCPAAQKILDFRREQQLRSDPAPAPADREQRAAEDNDDEKVSFA